MSRQVALLQKIRTALSKSSGELFRRPPCSTRLVDQFEERTNQSEENDDTQWLNNWLILRNLIDSNQNQLTKMGQMGPPKTERMVMEAISRRVGVEMPKPAHHSRDNIEELQYYFEKLYVPFDQYNKPIDENDNNQ
eukprot:139671_1